MSESNGRAARQYPSRYITHASLNSNSALQLPEGAHGWDAADSTWPEFQFEELDTQPFRWISGLDQALMSEFPDSFANERVRASIHMLLAEELTSGNLTVPYQLDIGPLIRSKVQSLFVWRTRQGAVALARAGESQFYNLGTALIRSRSASRLINSAARIEMSSRHGRSTQPRCSYPELDPGQAVLRSRRHLSYTIACLLSLKSTIGIGRLDAILTQYVLDPYRDSFSKLAARFFGCPAEVFSLIQPGDLEYVEELRAFVYCKNPTQVHRKLQAWRRFPLIGSIDRRYLHWDSTPVPRGFFDMLRHAEMGASPVKLMRVRYAASRNAAETMLQLPLEVAFPHSTPSLRANETPVSLALLNRLNPELRPRDRGTQKIMRETLARGPNEDGPFLDALCHAVIKRGWHKLSADLETIRRENYRQAWADEDLKWLFEPALQYPRFYKFLEDLTAWLEGAGIANAQRTLATLDLVQLLRMCLASAVAFRWGQATLLRTEYTPHCDWPALLRQPFVSGPYLFRSLTSEVALTVEGATMKHCVGNMGHQCAVGDTHLLSVAQGTRAIATIQVNPEEPPSESDSASFRMGAISGPGNSRVSTVLESHARTLLCKLNEPRSEVLNPEVLKFPYRERKQQWRALVESSEFDRFHELLMKDTDATLRWYRPVLCPGRRKTALFRAVEHVAASLSESADETGDAAAT